MRLSLPSTILAAAVAVAATTTAVAASTFVGVFGVAVESPVVGAPQIQYTLRASYIAPTKWRAAKAKKDAITRRYGPIGSCRFKLVITSRAIADVRETSAARIVRLLPATGRYVRDEGTRGTASWRVIRASGSTLTTGILTKTATTIRTQPAGGVVWLELRAVATPTRSCHSGGPREVAAGIATVLATGSLGGFEPS